MEKSLELSLEIYTRKSFLKVCMVSIIQGNAFEKIFLFVRFVLNKERYYFDKNWGFIKIRYINVKQRLNIHYTSPVQGTSKYLSSSLCSLEITSTF